MTLSSHVETHKPSATTSRFTSDDEILAAVSRVRETFDSGITRPLDWRERELRQLQRMVEDNEEEFLEALHKDLGKCRMEGVIAETGFIVNEIKLTLKNLRKWAKPERVKVPVAVMPGKAYIVREPLGPVLIISPWNYPFQLLISPLTGAIAAGNTAVLKPSEVAPATSAAVAKLLPRYLDASAYVVVEGGVAETTTLLAQRFEHIFYTGNGAVARVVMTAAARHLTPVTLELGGKSPCIVDEHADLDITAKRIMWGKFFNTGQTCVAPDYLLVHESIHDALLDKFERTLQHFYGADPQASADYGRIVNERHFDRLLPLLDSGTLVAGGKSERASRYIAPTILRDVSPDSPVMEDEIFGPILPVLRVSNVDEAIRFVNARAKPLALYVFTNDKDTAERVLSRTSSGGACVNDVVAHLGVPELPFGGVGPSGMGAYHGWHSFDTFSHKKSVLDKSIHLDAPLRYPPYGDNKLKWIKRLL
ncbi:MAG: aldehyde dehydrogenase family protein [Polyangiaceae bacterium]|nr:aldehyde dehydrogenase family protein [Polyangiaceae bacterium]